MCGYDEAGRASGTLCPECGLTRESARASLFPRRRYLLLLPLVPPLVVAPPFVYFAVEFSSNDKAIAVGCLFAPFLWLIVVAAAAQLHRWLRVAWGCLLVPAVLLFIWSALVFADLARPIKPYPGMPAYLPALERRLSPMVFAAYSGAAIGCWHCAGAIVIAVAERRRNRRA
jgi:hypothetical protein